MKLLICPGLPRCGTTYLFHQLASTGRAAFNVPRTKETNYFSRFPRLDEKLFRSMYTDYSDDKYFLDFSPAYLADSRAIFRMAESSHYHDIRMIINLRHPVDQAYAHYLHDLKAHISRGERPDPYYPFFCAASLRKYLIKRAPAIRILTDALGRDKIFPINFHTDLADLDSLRSRLCEFLKTDEISLAPERISPGGWMPYYVYGGAEGCDIAVADAIRTVPANHFLLVNGPESLIWDDVSDGVAFSLLRGATSWTRRIDRIQAQKFYDIVHNDFMEVLALLELDRDSFGSIGELTATVPSVEGPVVKSLPFRAELAHRLGQFSIDSWQTPDQSSGSPFETRNRATLNGSNERPELRLMKDTAIMPLTKVSGDEESQLSDLKDLCAVLNSAKQAEQKVSQSRTDILFIQTADNEKYDDLLSISSKAVREYCRKNNFYYYSYVGILRGYYTWQATFNRIPILKCLTEWGFSGWVCYLDADAFVADLKFDLLGYLADKRDAALIAAPGGQSYWWDVNAGVLFLNLGQPLAQTIVQEWNTAFCTITDDQLRAMTDWSLPNDQSLLHQVLRKVQHVERHLIIDRSHPPLINYGGRFVKQILRVTGSFEEREKRLRTEVSRVLG
jgi:hypothetical protein